MSKVVIIQRRMTHYRVAFFEELRRELREKGVELIVGYGCGTSAEESKSDAGSLSWAHQISTTYLLGGRICIQSFGHLVEGADMLIVTAENKLVNNLYYQFCMDSAKVALWGHGANLQGNSSSLRERLKRLLALKSDWWFGYTEMSRPLITRSGFPNERVTIVNNAVDTTEMNRFLQALPGGDRTTWRQENGVGSGSVGIFLGSLYSEKRIEFLLQSAVRIRGEMPDFELVVIGSGPKQPEVVEFCVRNDWVHYLGVRSGVEKVRALAACDIMLNPGLVGLGILDSFVCGVPMVTTDCGLHSPEVAYLKSGENGLMTADCMEKYVEAVIDLLKYPTRLEQISRGCKDSAKEYSVLNMARNFADGVERCLCLPPIRVGR